MFLSVILAYVLAAVFAFCGIMGTVHYVMEAPRDMGYFAFLAGLPAALWPLAVAIIISLLTQLACKVERWMLLWTMEQTPTTGRPSAPRRSAPAPHPAPATPPAISDAQPAITPPVMQEAPAPSGQEKQEAAIPLPPKPTAPRQPNGLNFFKLD